jgi:anti-sigma B factor antagonist
MAFELIRDRHGAVLVLSPRGRLDNDNAAEFELAAQELIAAGERNIVVDLAGLGYTSNAGLRVLGKMNKALKSPGMSLRLCGLTPSLKQVFDAAGIAMVFDIRPNLVAALADHPAARGAGELGREAARLLGAAVDVEPATVVPEATKRLAELAADLLKIGAPAPRPSRPMADATQLAMKIRPEDIAKAMAAQRPAAQGAWWKRLFGKGKST